MTDAPQKKDVVPTAYRERYKASGGTCGDFIAKKLQEIGKDGLPALQTVMKENHIPQSRWSGFNVGMQRMNLANVLRSTFLNGGDIYLLGKQYNVAHMSEDYNSELKNDDKSIAKFAEVNDLGTGPRVIKSLRRTLFEAAEKAKAEEAKAHKKADAEKAKAEKKAKAEADKKAKTEAAEKKKADAAKAKADKAEKAKSDKAAKEAKAKSDKAAKEAAKPAKAAAPAKTAPAKAATAPAKQPEHA